MTVYDLIEKLKYFPQDMNVYCNQVWKYNDDESYTRIYDIKYVDQYIIIKDKEKEKCVGIFIE